MSTLIDELEARKNDYILVASVITVMAGATNSKPNEVVKYLDAHHIDDHIALLYMNESYTFEPYNGHILGLGNDANITYFRKADVMAFEPITKHGIFGNLIQPPIYNNVSKAPPPPNHIKASAPFKQKTIGDVIKAEAKQRVADLEQKIADLQAENKNLNQQLSKQVDTPANDSILQAILNESHEHHAPDLKHAINLWNDLYIKGLIGTDSHSNKASLWIGNNTGYADDAKSSTDRIKEISSPSKHWSPHRKKENEK